MQPQWEHKCCIKQGVKGHLVLDSSRAQVSWLLRSLMRQQGTKIFTQGVP